MVVGPVVCWPKAGLVWWGGGSSGDWALSVVMGPSGGRVRETAGVSRPWLAVSCWMVVPQCCFPLWGGIFVRHVKELTRVTEINTKIVQSNFLKLVLISVTRVSSLTRPTKIPALNTCQNCHLAFYWGIGCYSNNPKYPPKTLNFCHFRASKLANNPWTTVLDQNWTYLNA